MTEQEIIDELTSCISRFSPITARAAIRCKFKCEYCGRFLLASIEDYDTWQWDHLQPVAKGGAESEANGIVSCKFCNFMKRAYTPSQSLAELGRDRYIAEVRSFLMGKRQKKLEKLGTPSGPPLELGYNLSRIIGTWRCVPDFPEPQENSDFADQEQPDKHVLGPAMTILVIDFPIGISVVTCVRLSIAPRVFTFA